MAKKLTRKTAISKIKKVEDALLTAQGVIGKYIRDLQAVRAWLEGAEGGEGQ